MGKRIITIVVFVLAVVAIFVAVTERDRFTAAGRQARLLRVLERSDLILRRSCYSMETYVDASRWGSMSESDQQRAARALADYCVDQGSAGQMTILDSETRSKLAHWDGTGFKR